MKDFFKRLRELDINTLPDPSTITDVDEKAQLVKRLRSMGIKVKEIAEYMGISVPYVYKLKNMAIDHIKSELECQTMFDSYLETEQMIIDQIDFYKNEQRKLRSGYKFQEKDEEGNIVTTEKKGSPRDFKEIASLIQSYEKMLIDLRRFVGVLPDKDVDIFTPVTRQVQETEETSLDNLDNEELSKLILDRLLKGGQSVKGNSLRDVKDDPIV